MVLSAQTRPGCQDVHPAVVYIITIHNNFTEEQSNSHISFSVFWTKLILPGNWLLQVAVLWLPRPWKIHTVLSSPPTLPSNVFSQKSLVEKGILYCNPSEDLQMPKSALAPFLSSHQRFLLLFRHVLVKKKEPDHFARTLFLEAITLIMNKRATVCKQAIGDISRYKWLFFSSLWQLPGYQLFSKHFRLHETGIMGKCYCLPFHTWQKQFPHEIQV